MKKTSIHNCSKNTLLCNLFAIWIIWRPGEFIDFLEKSKQTQQKFHEAKFSRGENTGQRKFRSTKLPAGELSVTLSSSVTNCF